MSMFSKLMAATGRKQVGARNVFRPNGQARHAFDGRIVGRYRPLGANSWDDYALVAEDGETVSVFPTVRIQLEPTGARFRMQWHGDVVVVEWTPTDEQRRALGDDGDVRAAFLRDCVDVAGSKSGIGVGAFIARTLNR